MKYTNEFIEKVLNLGILNYPFEKCASILGVEESNLNNFLRDISDKTTALGKAYQSGIDLYDFEIDTKLYQLAKTGDMKAMGLIEMRRKSFKKK